MTFDAPRIATHFPWLMAVLLTPFCFGGVSEGCQVAVTFLVAVSICLNLLNLRSLPESALGKTALAGLILLICGSFLPISRTVLPSLEAFSLRTHTFTFAPGETVRCAWQLGTAFACFLLAREAMRVPKFSAWLTLGIAISAALMSLTEIWRLLDGQGIWKETHHYPAGTFANRNHFAAWMTAAAMLTFGALLRTVRKIRGSDNSAARTWIEGALYSVAIGLAVTLVVMSGSRGGLLSLGAGLTTWGALLWFRKTRGLVLVCFGTFLVGVVLVFALGGGLSMSRLDTGLGFKMQIWRETLQLFGRFPLFGIGLGAFADVFSAVKTFHGSGSILFVENEYLQWIVEMGAIGTLFAVLGVAALAKGVNKALRSREVPKIELLFGGIAALAALFAHAMFEFIFHVPSILLLASVLLGVVAGLSQQSLHKVEPAALKRDFAGSAALVLVLGGISLQQARGMQAWGASPDWRSRITAVNVWPLAPERAIETVRTVVSESPGAESSRTYVAGESILGNALAWRPYNWELRLERAWLEIAFGQSVESALVAARAAILTNPLQPKIPLRFAAALAERHPAYALQFVRSAPTQEYEDVREALRIGWQVTGNASILWELTPATSAGLRALAQFAKEQNLTAVAFEAESQLLNQHGSRH